MKNIVIVGPTASGKTAVAAALAKMINGEIISADSRQVYKYLDIGTNKSGEWDKVIKARFFNGIAQYLTDIIEPDAKFSAGDFAKLALEEVKRLKKAGKVPIIVGGTGLYIRALIDGLAPMPERNEEVRRKLQEKLLEKGKEYLYDKLNKVDPESAENNRHNPQRLIRALEVFEVTGVPISRLQKKTVKPDEEFVQFGLGWPREIIYKRIDRRSTDMLRSGMIEETRMSLSKGFKETAEAFKGIGYRDVLDHIAGKIDLKELEYRLRRDTRRYAKRQMTWFRSDKRINWISLKESTFSAEKTARSIFKKIDNLI